MGTTESAGSPGPRTLLDTVEGVVASLGRSHVDTDQIIPKPFLKRIERTGYGAFIFYDGRAAPSSTRRPGR